MLSNGVIHCSKYLIFPQDRRERAPEAAILTGSSLNYTERAGMVWEPRGLPSRFIWIELQNRCQWRWGLDLDDLTENQPQPSARLKTLTSTLIIPDITKTSSNNCLLLHNFKILLPYMAASYLPTAHALIGYFEVKWHVTMKLFPSKIFERATLQNLWR